MVFPTATKEPANLTVFFVFSYVLFCVLDQLRETDCIQDFFESWIMCFVVENIICSSIYKTFSECQIVKIIFPRFGIGGAIIIPFGDKGR
jgi:hypothetical protein